MGYVKGIYKVGYCYENEMWVGKGYMGWISPKKSIVQSQNLNKAFVFHLIRVYLKKKIKCCIITHVI